MAGWAPALWALNYFETSRRSGGGPWLEEGENVVGLDASILSPPKIWEASGHLANFTDPLVECGSCNSRHREDHLDDPIVCPSCGERNVLTAAKHFNLMFQTFAGPTRETPHEVYLRPETAQGMFINFAAVQMSARLKPPFGIAQIGKSFRNEITPGNFAFRTREFEQMELEFSSYRRRKRGLARLLAEGTARMVSEPRTS